jgi:glycosyltransferase involved in cell wall biosynthesis
MKALFLSYDGLTDPLGGSQIIPYITGLAASGHKLTVLSFEKPERLSGGREAVERRFAGTNVRWIPMRYHRRPPVISTVFDLARMTLAALWHSSRRGISIVHCRSYVPALAGFVVARAVGAAFVFDMRGFWPDERVEGKLWNLKRAHYRLIYRFFKKWETRLLTGADAVVCLTENGLREMERWDGMEKLREKTTVIPCSVDLDHFDPALYSTEQRNSLRASLGVEGGELLCGYSGSIGTWYRPEPMFKLFSMVRETRPRAKFLFLTPDSPAEVLSFAARAGVPASAVIVRHATRSEMPLLLRCLDVAFSFIEPSFSKKASSATKVGEFLAMGIPVVANSGIGDQDQLLSRVGIVIDDFSAASLADAVRRLPALLNLAASEMRSVATEELGLVSAHGRYEDLYRHAGLKARGGLLRRTE